MSKYYWLDDNGNVYEVTKEQYESLNAEKQNVVVNKTEFPSKGFNIITRFVGIENEILVTYVDIHIGRYKSKLDISPKHATTVAEAQKNHSEMVAQLNNI